jgi:hypothetical protein
VGLDLDNAWAGMNRDIEELKMDAFGWVMLLSFSLLPLASLILLAFRRWIAVLPLLGWLALLVLWVLYYATDWFRPSAEGQRSWSSSPSWSAGSSCSPLRARRVVDAPTR